MLSTVALLNGMHQKMVGEQEPEVFKTLLNVASFRLNFKLVADSDSAGSLRHLAVIATHRLPPIAVSDVPLPSLTSRVASVTMTPSILLSTRREYMFSVSLNKLQVFVFHTHIGASPVRNCRYKVVSVLCEFMSISWIIDSPDSA